MKKSFLILLMMVCMPVLGFSQSATQTINYEGATP